MSILKYRSLFPNSFRVVEISVDEGILSAINLAKYSEFAVVRMIGSIWDS
jgi:hypothetical protein